MTACCSSRRCTDYNTFISCIKRNLGVVDFIRGDCPVANLALCEGTLQTIDVGRIDDIALNACCVKFGSSDTPCSNTVCGDSPGSNL